MRLGLLLAVLFSLSIKVFAEEDCKFFDKENPEGQVTLTGKLTMNKVTETAGREIAENNKNIRFVLESKQSFKMQGADSNSPSKCSAKTYTLNLDEEAQGLAEEVLEQDLKVQVTGFLSDASKEEEGLNNTVVQVNRLSVADKL